MIANRIYIGAVAVVPTQATNPYTSPQLIGPSRRRVLAEFKRAGQVRGWAFWFAPSTGGARRLQGPDEIDWDTSGID